MTPFPKCRSKPRSVVSQNEIQGRAAEIARDILPEIRERLKFLCEVGLGYLQLGRGVPTLSGGESAAHSAGGAARFESQRRALRAG